MKKTLLVDVGNSSIAIAIWDGVSFSEPRYFSHDDLKGELGRLSQDFNTLILSSVVPSLTPLFESLFSNCYVVTHEAIPHLHIRSSAPEQIGVDRLMAALGAYERYQKSTVVVDSGTALTFCYTNSDGGYEGGLIFPGMKIASQSLADYTAKIPLIEVAPKSEIIGQTTKEAVEAGLYHGYIALINGLIQQYKDFDPSVTVIGTGGGLEVLHDHLNLDVFEPQLVMHGLSCCARESLF